VRLGALAWLLVIAPVDVATMLAGLVSGTQDPIGLIGLALVSLRVLVAALGLMLGRRLARGSGYPGTSATTMALAWALSDLVTLASVLASGGLPSNRAPGDAQLVWLAHAVAAVVVVMAASRD
jgi:hypothetical protein